MYTVLFSCRNYRVMSVGQGTRLAIWNLAHVCGLSKKIGLFPNPNHHYTMAKQSSDETDFNLTQSLIFNGKQWIKPSGTSSPGTQHSTESFTPRYVPIFPKYSTIINLSLPNLVYQLYLSNSIYPY